MKDKVKDVQGHWVVIGGCQIYFSASKLERHVKLSWQKSRQKLVKIKLSCFKLWSHMVLGNLMIISLIPVNFIQEPCDIFRHNVMHVDS